MNDCEYGAPTNPSASEGVVIETGVHAPPGLHVAKETFSVYVEPEGGVTAMSWTTTVKAWLAGTVKEYVVLPAEVPGSAR